LSPSQTADVHRVAQRTIQNQLAIKKLTEENEILKKELLHLKNEIERFRPWIERWIFESAPASVPSSPSNLPIIEEVVPHAKKTSTQTRKKRTSELEVNSAHHSSKRVSELEANGSSKRISEIDVNRAKTSKRVEVEVQSAKMKRPSEKEIDKFEKNGGNLSAKRSPPAGPRPKSQMVKGARTISESDKPVQKVKREKKVENAQTEKEEVIKSPKRTPKKKE